ncbi:MAG: response regulator [Proteobacteria bacterium]|nr:response regulator [Pseudomonadota bacterium]
MNKVFLTLTIALYFIAVVWLMVTSGPLEAGFAWILPVSAGLVLLLAVLVRHLSLVAKFNHAPASQWLSDSEVSYVTALNQALLRGSLSARVVIDEDSTIVECNKALCELTGYAESELVGADMAKMLIPERYRNAHKKGMVHYSQTGEGPVIDNRTEIEMLVSNGSEIPIELTVSVINGFPKKYFAAEIRDLRQRRAIEQDLRSAKEAAEAANQAQSRFVANMSHEIRTPLNAVLGIVNLLREVVDEDERRQLLDTVEKSGNLLLSVVNDILDYSKIEAEEMFLVESPLALVELVKESVKLYQPLAREKGLEIVAECDPVCSGYVMGDGSKLAQILNNLISNAVKFTDAGVVTVSLQRGNKVAEGWEYKLSVTDTGIGIAAEQVDNIFDVFAQVDESDTRRHFGSGLGLAISRQLTALMDGELLVSSTVGVGSTFCLALELPDGEQPHANEHAVHQRIAKTQTLPILLVEDSPANQLVVRIALQRAGYQVTVASDGIEACEQLQDHGPFSLVLTDIQMPRMGGLEVARWIRDAGMTMPVIALTAKAFKEDQEACFAAGMNDFLAKPIDFDLLEKAMNRWVSSVSNDASGESQLAELLRKMFGDEDFNEAYGIVRGELESIREQVRVALRQHNTQALGDIVHRLNGIAGNYGLLALAKACEAFEESAESDSAELIQTLEQSITALLSPD